MKRISLLIVTALFSAAGCGIETSPKMVALAPANTSTSVTPSTSAAPIAPANTDEAPAPVKQIAFRVEGMSCPTGCYPSVREAIAKQKNVTDVELAPQKEKDVIDNPIVFVKYTGELNIPATIKAISKVGFDASQADATTVDPS